MTTYMVQTDRILDNYNLIKKRINHTSIIPVLSGNAFGLGDVAVAQLLAEQEGLRLFAVSRLEEAERLKTAVPGIDVLLITPYASESELERIIRADIIASVGTNECAVLLSGLAGRLKRKARAHIKFDTGCGRTGYLPEDAREAAQTLKYLDSITIEGIYTDLLGVKKEKRARLQYEIFMQILRTFSREEVDYGITHIVSTSGALLYPWACMDAVRVGEGLTGRLGIKDKWGFKKVGRLVSEVSDVRWVPAGHTVCDNGSVKIRKPTKIAAVPVGYADGLFVGKKTGFSIFGRRKSYCEIAGKRVTVIGQPGYTTTIINVTSIECTPGDMVSFDVSPFYVSSNLRRDYV